jgi:hypothetical protein
MTLREGLAVVEAYVRWAEQILLELRARAGHAGTSGQSRPRAELGA